VAEFNTYDILKQRYLLLTREALAVLKDRVKQGTGPPRDRRRRAGRPEV
jgi:large subunit ribosomal protein L4